MFVLPQGMGRGGPVRKSAGCPNCGRSVLGCIEADFCKRRLILQGSFLCSQDLHTSALLLWFQLLHLLDRSKLKMCSSSHYLKNIRNKYVIFPPFFSARLCEFCSFFSPEKYVIFHRLISVEMFMESQIIAGRQRVLQIFSTVYTKFG